MHTGAAFGAEGQGKKGSLSDLEPSLKRRGEMLQLPARDHPLRKQSPYAAQSGGCCQGPDPRDHEATVTSQGMTHPGEPGKVGGSHCTLRAFTFITGPGAAEHEADLDHHHVSVMAAAGAESQPWGCGSGGFPALQPGP